MSDRNYLVSVAQPSRIVMVSVVILFVLLPSWATAATASGTFNEINSTLGGGVRFAEGGTQADLMFSLGMLRLSDRKYSSYNVEVDWSSSGTLDFFSVMPRIEFGLGKAKMSGSYDVSVKTTYLALMAGYGSGTYWDTKYVPEYGTEEEIEVGIKGVPIYAAIGYKKFGGFQFWVEAIAGLIIVNSEDPDYGDAEAPSTIPSFGVRIGIGYDSFQKAWSP